MDVEDYGDACHLLNTATGRFLRRRDMMARLLRSHLVIAVAAGGSLVLADKISPQAGVRVLNPLTGRSICFKAPVRDYISVENVATVLGSSPTLVLCSVHDKLYRADPESECFAMYTVRKNSPVLRQAVANGVYDLTIKSLAFPDHDHRLITQPGRWPFLVESAGETLAFVMRQHRVEVFGFKIDAAGGNNELTGPVKSIGGRAIFVGISRCLCIDASKFPAIDPDCIYYMGSVGSEYQQICRYDMKKEKAERITGIPLVTDHSRPFTIIKLLSCYTFDIQILTNV